MKNIKLFDYQEDMKERIEKALRLHRSVMAQMPTGTGKTVLLASVVESFLREHSNCHVWIVAHRRELVSQIKDTLNKFLLNFSFSNHPVPLSKEGFSKITPSLFTIKEGSTSHPDPLTLRGEGGNRPTRCSEPLRSKVGGPSKVFAKLCGMGPHGKRWGIGWVLPCSKAWWQRMVIELGLSSGYLMAGLLFPAKFIAERIFG